jgi:protein-S-isoprenylcysteine O-methyltransferase Ste14
MMEHELTTADDNAGVRIFPPAVFVVALAIGFLARYLWPVRIEPAELAAVGWMSGLVLVALGVALGAWSVALFFRSGTTPNPTRPTTTLVIRGPYLLTRNPMYLSWVMLCFGIALMANSLWLLLVVVPAAIVIRRTAIDREERYLASKFGDEYRAYCARVRRWL